MTVTDELATVLFGLATDSQTTEDFTTQITMEITRWALDHGWFPRAEARVRLPRSSGQHPRLGYVDLVINRGPVGPDLAIEIDSTDKPWSLAKLRYAAAAGMHAIWVRWGDQAWAGVYDEVDVIQLPALRQPASRRRSSQMTLWS